MKIYLAYLAGWWFSTDTLVSSINKTHRDITEILMKVALSTTTPNPYEGGVIW